MPYRDDHDEALWRITGYACRHCGAGARIKNAGATEGEVVSVEHLTFCPLFREVKRPVERVETPLFRQPPELSQTLESC